MNLRDCLIRHGIVNSRRVCRLPIAVQLFFRNLLHTCDGAGRFLADADELRIALYQHALDRVTRLHVSRWMAECHQAELVRLYTGPDGRGYGEVLNYGQRDSKRRVLHPAREAEQLNFVAPLPERATPEIIPDPPDPEVRNPRCADSFELNRREMKPPTPAAAAAAGREEVFPIRYFSDRLARTLAELCGIDTAQLTVAGKRSLTGTISALQKVKPDLHPDDLERAAAAWKLKFPTASLTPRAMNQHWAMLVGTKVAVKVAPLVEPEPLGWRDWINEETPGTKYARDGECEGTPWHDLPAEYRRYLISQLARRVPA
jgi:hypothetical protein